MFLIDSQEPDYDLHLRDDQPAPISPTTCSQGHRSTLSLPTREGGSICLLCFSNLVSDPRAPTVHVSYALSQLSIAISHPQFLRSLLSSQAHFLVSPLLDALSSYDDDPIAHQLVDLISVLCSNGEPSILCEFISRVADKLSSGALAWSRRQLYMLHCFGVLTNSQINDFYAHIKDKVSLVHNLVAGLQLPSEEIRGEILFVLYKLAMLQYVCGDVDGTHVLLTFCPNLLVLSLDILAKTQRDDVRLNCVALLTTLVQQGFFDISSANDVSSMSFGEAYGFMQKTGDTTDGRSLNILLAEAVKGPLLSTDSQVQISTLDLISHYLSQENLPINQMQVLIEENLADYVFEILRLSECKDPVVNSCLRVLGLFARAEQAFRKRLVVGFASVIPVLQYVAEIPLHPFQIQTLELIRSCIFDYPGVASRSHVKEIVIVLSRLLKKYYSEEMELLPEAFKTVCSIFVGVLRTPSFSGTPELVASLQGSLTHAILASQSVFKKYSEQILHGLFLLKEAYAYCHNLFSVGNRSGSELKHCILDVCTSHLLPWFLTAISELDEESTAAVMETFHFILLRDSDFQVREFAEVIVSAAWFSFSFGCLGYFSTEKIRLRVYEMFSSLVDILLGDNKGQPIRDATPCLPSDPVDLLFLLGQDSTNNVELSTCQSAVLLILHTSSLLNDRLADDKLVLESLEQYMLVNGMRLTSKLCNSSAATYLVNLYGLYRGLQNVSYRIPYSLEAESFIFYVLGKNEWNFNLAEIHPAALKWFFQQEKVTRPLSYEILKMFRYNGSGGNQIILKGDNRQGFDIRIVADVVAAEDTHGPMAFVSLLKEIAGGYEHEDDITLVLCLMITVTCFVPSASHQLCLHGVGNAIQTVLCSSIYSSSQDVFISVLLLTFNLLSSVNSEALYSDDSWVAISMRLVNHLNTRDCNWNPEDLFIIGIFCLFLHHSSEDAFAEAAKIIVLNSTLASVINIVVSAACSKGLALTEYDDETSMGYNITFTLLLHFFSLRSLGDVFQDDVLWQSLFKPSNEAQPLALVNISCADLCRLMQFGSPPLKLVASYCLYELFTRLSKQIGMEYKLKFSMGYLKSVMAVLEGLIFYSDTRVSMNCACCLSIIIGWEDSEMPERSVIAQNHNWYRLIVEEMFMSLAAPSLASNSFSNHYKPAVYVTIALLRLRNRPNWMRTVFDDTCLSGIIGNLTMANISTEMVLLFRELLNAKFLNTEQIASLHHVFQACRKQIYTGNIWDDTTEEDIQKTFSCIDDVAEVAKYLIHLISSEILPHITSSRKSQSQKELLLDEMDNFFGTLAVEDGNSVTSLD